MNKEECIRILEKTSRQNISFLEDNQYRYKMANKDNKYDDIIKSHQDNLDEYHRAIKYLKENLK